MNNVKEGDLVICIDDTNSNGYLKKGKIYVVSNTVDEFDLEGVPNGWARCRFEKVN